MNTLSDREKRDIEKMAGDKDYYYFLPEHRKTAAVSQAAVSASGHNLEYVPETVATREICRTALGARDADCTLLSCIPFSDVQKEGIQRFSGNTPAFVLYSVVDITDASMAREAVKRDAYCLQLVPDKLVTDELCKIALQHPDANRKVLEFIPEKFRTPEIRKMAEEKFGSNPVKKEEISPLEKKKSRGIA